MKTHGPNSPTSIRGLRERYKLRGLLETRKQAEADLRTAEMVGPFGKGFDLMKNPGSDQTYIVANQAGSTLAPGAAGLLANTSGKPGGEARIGGATAGKKGASSASRSHRRRGTPVVAVNQYAFGEDGADSFAMLYSEGTFVSVRGSMAGSLSGVLGIVTEDSSDLIGVGSLLRKDGNDFTVWDVEGETTYTYSAPAGWRLLTPLYYQNGMLYWFEGEDVVSEVTTSFDIRLRIAKTDLTDEATIRTVTRDIAGAQADLGGSTIEYFMDTGEYAASMAVDADGAVVYFGVRPQDVNGERTDIWQTQFRFALSGGAPSSREWETPEGTTFSAVTLAAQLFVVAIARVDLGGNVVVMQKSDDASAAMADYWSVDALATSGFSVLSVGTGGSIVQAHSSAGYLVRGSTSGVEIASAIDDFDGINFPSALFYFGE